MSPYSRLPHWIGRLWIALIAVSVVYLPLYVFLRATGGPIPPIPGRYWPVAVWGVFALLLAVMSFWAWLQAGKRGPDAEQAFGVLTPSKVARRTGIAGTDWVGLVASALAAATALPSAYWFAWVVLVFVVFAANAVLGPVDRWPVRGVDDDEAEQDPKAA